MYRYRIQKQVLPIGAAAHLHHLSGTSDLLSQILAPFFHFPFISFSSQPLSTRVDSLHLSCTVIFFLSPVEVTQLHTFLFSSVELPFDWIMVSTFYCVIMLASCTTIKPTGLERLHKTLPSTTLYYKACRKYVSVRLCTTKLEFVPVLLCTIKLAQSTCQYNLVLQSLHKVVPSTTLYYKVCTKYFPVRLCTTKLAQSTLQYYFCTTKLAQSTSQYYFVLQSLHKARPSIILYYKLAESTSQYLCTTKLALSTSQYYFVLQSLHKELLSTTLYYKAGTKYFPVLLCTTKLAQRTSQHYFVLQSWHKVLPSTFVLQSLHKALPSAALCHKACNKYFPVLFCITKLAQSPPSTTFVPQSLHKVLPSTALCYKACSKYIPDYPSIALHYKACNTIEN